MLAQPAAQQHSVRQPAAAQGAAQDADAGPGNGMAPPAAGPTAGAIHWWQDPKMTFGPPGDPEFLATQAAQEQARLLSSIIDIIFAGLSARCLKL